MSCPRCGAANQCLMEAAVKVGATTDVKGAGCTGDQRCWCFQVPLTSAQRAMLPQSNSCYCAACLDILVQEIKN